MARMDLNQGRTDVRFVAQTRILVCAGLIQTSVWTTRTSIGAVRTPVSSHRHVFGCAMDSYIHPFGQHGRQSGPYTDVCFITQTCIWCTLDSYRAAWTTWTHLEPRRRPFRHADSAGLMQRSVWTTRTSFGAVQTSVSSYGHVFWCALDSNRRPFRPHGPHLKPCRRLFRQIGSR